ncbi:MAG: ferrous iron transport protein A [Rhodobacteraceae bacterium]|nr:ferrous iron transport protein A [Paracoccaceae bacterium]
MTISDKNTRDCPGQNGKRTAMVGLFQKPTARLDRQVDGLQAADAPGRRGRRHPQDECRHASGQPCSAPDGIPQDCTAGPVACPLTLADEGVWLEVVALQSGRRSHHRLIDLGLTVGARIRILQRGGSCPMLIGVSDSRLALGHGLAGKILVAPANEDPHTRSDD